MIIQSLVKRYEDVEKQGVPPGWQRRSAQFALELSEDGELSNILQLGDTDKKNPSQEFVLPSIGSGRSGTKAFETAYFLCDDGNYMLGLSPERFESARKLHAPLLEGVDSPLARAIAAYFAAGIPALPPGYDEKKGPQARYVFKLQGENAVADFSDREIRRAWDKAYAAQKAGGEQIRCLVTGELDGVMELHEKIELPGVTMSKQPLIAMNMQTSFRSYGETPNDPPARMGQNAAFAYAAALNGLLRSGENRQSIGADTLVYWAEDGGGAEEEVFSWLSEPKQEDAGILDDIMKRAAAGLPINPEGCRPESMFYLLCLSPNAARISVRFFYAKSFGEILRNNIEHHLRMEIAGGDKDIFKYPPVWLVLSETTIKKKAAEVAPLLGGQYLYSILTGGPYPMTLYQAILGRVRAGEKINRVKAAVIKAVLIKNFNESEVTTVALNAASDNKPYVLGRLFSVLEQLQQRSAGGDLNATIRDRYFTSACANPGSVFPTLLKLSFHHAAKLDKAGEVYYEKLKTELLGKLDAESPFPSALALDDQGRFILGYYHQAQYFFTPKKDKEEPKDE